MWHKYALSAMPGFIFSFPTVQSTTWFEGNSRFKAFTFLLFLLWHFLLSLLCQASLFCFPWCKVQFGLREIRVFRGFYIFHKKRIMIMNRTTFSTTAPPSLEVKVIKLLNWSSFCSNVVASTIWMQETELNQGNPLDAHNITDRTYFNLGCWLLIQD